MTLTEYQNDVNLLIQIFTDTSVNFERKKSILSLYLGVKKFEDEKLLLMIEMAELKISQQFIEKWLFWAKSDEKDRMIKIDENGVTKLPDYESSSLDSGIFTLIKLLQKSLTNPNYAFEEIDDRYLMNPTEPNRDSYAMLRLK